MNDPARNFLIFHFCLFITAVKSVKPSSLKYLAGNFQLSFLYLNARPLESKHDKFELFVASTGLLFDVNIVPETWHTKKIPLGLLKEAIKPC